MDTLERAKNELRQNWHQGLNCPCCGQRVQLYERRIYATPCRDLIRLYRLPPGFHHNREFKPDISAGDFSKLRYWGLIEQAPNDDSSKRSAGMWRITEKGTQFVKSEIRVPRICYVYNQKARDFGDETVNIVEALGDKFDYRELMGYLI